MESELKMDPDPVYCPACSEACRWLDDGDLIECQGVDSEDERRCGYIFVDAYGSKRKTLEAHNTLARHAEIGALVERIVENRQSLSINDVNPDVVLASTPSGTESGLSLLEALRSLAAELEELSDE